VRSRLHDQPVRLLEAEIATALVRGGEQLQELIPGQAREIVESHYVVLAERDQHAGRQSAKCREIIETRDWSQEL